MMSYMPKLSFLILGLLYTCMSLADTTTLETCITKLGETSAANVPSTTYALTVSFTATKYATTTPIKTITPAQSRTTVTSTSTSITTIKITSGTAIFTSTSTASLTNTVTASAITSTNVVTSTSTASAAVYTVPTPSGFTPLASASGYIAKKRSYPLVPRGEASGGVKWSVNDGQLTCSPALYPTAVTCGKLVEQVTTSTRVATASPSTTTVPASTSTITVTRSTTSTITSRVGASSTSVITSTTTVYTTIYPTTSITTTSTVTYIPPQSTTYAACATNNQISRANGGNGFYGYAATTGGDGRTLVYNQVDGTSDPYDCCVACQTFAGNCGGYAFSLDDDGVTGLCTLESYTTATCDPDYFGLSYKTGSGFGDDLTIGNGPCGQYANGGNSF